MEENFKYREVVCDFNNEEGFWCVDAWWADDEEEENGMVIAVIDEVSGNVYYIDQDARYNSLAQEVIKEKVKEIRK